MGLWWTATGRQLWLLYGFALLARLAPIWGDPLRHEGIHFYVATTWGAATSNVEPSGELAHWLWARPLYSFLMRFASVGGLEGARLVSVLLTAALPVVAFRLARHTGISARIAWGLAAVLAVHPLFWFHGATSSPHSIAAALALAGVHEHLRGRIGTALAAFLAAAWIDAVVGVLLAAILARLLIQGQREGRTSVWPVDLDKPQTSYLYVLLLALAPTVQALRLDVRFDGVNFDPPPTLALDFTFGALGAAVALAGLFFRRSRPWAALALLLALVPVAQYVAFGRAWDTGRQVLPALFVVFAGAALLQHARERAPSDVRPTRAAGALVGFTILAAVALPQAGSPLGMPDGEPLVQTADGLFTRSLRAMEPHLPAGASVYTIDVPWYDVVYLARHEATFRFGFTRSAFIDEHWVPGFDIDAPGARAGSMESRPAVLQLAAALENATHVIVQEHRAPLNEAVRLTYASCIEVDAPDHVLVLPAGCQGLGDRLWTAYQSRLPPR